MKINNQIKKGNKVTIEAETEYSELKPYSENAYKEAAKEIKIPGFRQGKVPPHILKTYINEEAVMDRAIQKMISDLYPKMVEEAKIEPVNYPDVEIVKLEKEKPFVFKISVDVYPEVKLGNYKSVKVNKPSTHVAEKEIDDAIEAMRNNLATVVKITDRELRENDIAAIDIKTVSESKPVPQLTRRGIKLEVGKAQISVEFDSALLGMKIGENKKFSLTMPQGFLVQPLQGKTVEFDVTLREISEKALPPLDDMFAKTVSRASTVDDMRKELKAYIEEDKKRYSDQVVRDSTLDKVSEFIDADIPQGMIEIETDHMIEDLDNNLKRNGSNIDIYLKSTKKTIESIRSEFKEPSVKRVKAKLFLRKIVEDEKIEALPEDVEAEIQEMSKTTNKSAEEIKKNVGEGGIEAIKDYILRKKAVDYIVSKIKIES